MKSILCFPRCEGGPPQNMADRCSPKLSGDQLLPACIIFKLTRKELMFVCLTTKSKFINIQGQGVEGGARGIPL
jgi:hypothetical protein